MTQLWDEFFAVLKETVELNASLALYRFRAAKTGVVSSIGRAFYRLCYKFGLSAQRTPTCPAAKHPLFGITVIIALHPLPGVARHVDAAVRTYPAGYTANRLHPCTTD